MIRAASIVALAAALAPATALAHHGNDPKYHGSMPNQITAGGAPLCVAQYSVDRRDIDGNLHESNVASVPCLGIDIGFARELGRWFDLRLRFGYQKPFPTSELVVDTLHEFRVTLAPELLVYQQKDRLTVTIGPEIGFQASLLNAIDPGVVVDTQPVGRAFSSAWALGWHVGVVAGIRGWVTYHAGLFAELGAGHARVSGDDATIESGWLGRVVLGWADRF